MAVRTKLNFYEIEKCGYYCGDVHQFVDVTQLLADLEDFAHQDGCTLAATKLFDSTEGANPLLPVYCMYARPFGAFDDRLVVTWNQTPENDGRVPSVDPEAETGTADVDFTDLPLGNIPGYASYYWFLPRQRVFGILRFENRIKNGHRGLKKYLGEYLRKEATFADVTLQGDRVAINGYRETPRDELRVDVDPCFESRPRRGHSQLAYLRENRERIYRVIRKGEVNWDVRIERGAWKRGLDVVFGRDREEVRERSLQQDGRKYKFEFDVSVKEDEFEEIVENFTMGERSDFENVGFVLEGESSKVYWLSDALLKTELELDLRRANDEIIEYESLQDALIATRGELIEKLLTD